MKKTERMTVKEWASQFSLETKTEIEEFIKTGKLKELTGTIDGCYDAIIRDNDELLFAEITFDIDGCVEDLHCTCNSGFCVHLAAMLWKIRRGEVLIREDTEETE